jgi:excisionase family DNA binding protein
VGDDFEFLRLEVDRLSFGPPAAAPTGSPATPAATATNDPTGPGGAPSSGPFAFRVLQTHPEGGDQPDPGVIKPQWFRTLAPVGVTGFEPATSGSQSSSGGLSGTSSGSQPSDFPRDEDSPRSELQAGLVGFPPPFATRLLPVMEHIPAPPVSAEANVAFLTVRQTAQALKVSTKTVYSICARGDLEYVRVSNAIRVPRVALEAYLRRPSRP